MKRYRGVSVKRNDDDTTLLLLLLLQLLLLLLLLLLLVLVLVKQKHVTCETVEQKWINKEKIKYMDTEMNRRHFVKPGAIYLRYDVKTLEIRELLYPRTVTGLIIPRALVPKKQMVVERLVFGVDSDSLPDSLSLCTIICIYNTIQYNTIQYNTILQY